MSYTLSFVSPEGRNIGTNAVESLDDFSHALVNDEFGNDHRIEVENGQYVVCRDCHDSDDCPTTAPVRNFLYENDITPFA